MEIKEQEHDCEFFLMTDVAVYACECDPHRIEIDKQEYVAVELFNAQTAEVERLKGTIGVECVKQLIEAKKLIKEVLTEIDSGQGLVDMQKEMHLRNKIVEFLKPESK